MSQAELAQRSGLAIDASAISRIESGDRSVRLSEAVAIASALDQQLLSPALAERVDPVRQLVDDAVAAVEEIERAQLADIVAADRLHQALVAGRAVMERLDELVSHFADLAPDLQVWVLRKLSAFERGREPEREIYARALKASAPEVRERLANDE